MSKDGIRTLDLEEIRTKIFISVPLLLRWGANGAGFYE